MLVFEGRAEIFATRGRDLPHCRGHSHHAEDVRNGLEPSLRINQHNMTADDPTKQHNRATCPPSTSNVTAAGPRDSIMTQLQPAGPNRDSALKNQREDGCSEPQNVGDHTILEHEAQRNCAPTYRLAAPQLAHHPDVWGTGSNQCARLRANQQHKTATNTTKQRSRASCTPPTRNVTAAGASPTIKGPARARRTQYILLGCYLSVLCTIPATRCCSRLFTPLSF
jgi:hypothetical protein